MNIRIRPPKQSMRKLPKPNIFTPALKHTHACTYGQTPSRTSHKSSNDQNILNELGDAQTIRSCWQTGRRGQASPTARNFAIVILCTLCLVCLKSALACFFSPSEFFLFLLFRMALSTGWNVFCKNLFNQLVIIVPRSVITREFDGQ